MNLEQLMTPDEFAASGIHRLGESERASLFRWGLRMYSSGRHLVEQIDAVKYDGHLIVLEDGSRWEVDDIDTTTASIWNALDKVVVIDGEMYNLEDCEKVDVTEDDD